MHPDLLAVHDLWRRDHEMDGLKATLLGLERAVDDGKARLAAAEQALADARATDAALHAEERGINRRLDDYTRKRDKTRSMIDEGRAPDYGAAEKQYQQCADIVDELETSLLELMEKREAAQHHIDACSFRVGQARARLDAARSARAEQEPPARARLAELTPQRDDAWKDLPRYLHGQYIDLRRRGRDVIAEIVDGSCAACHMQVQPQITIEVASERKAHTCRGCDRWLVVPTQTEED